MIQIKYNVDTKDWKQKFPRFKIYISRTVDETFKVIKTSSLDTTVSFFLTSNQNIKKLNHKYRKKNKPTNVLSFPMKSYCEGSYQLGDIVMASQSLLKESTAMKIAKYDFLCKITIHGMLHLLGYDHKTELEYNQMNKFENKIFDNLKQNQ